MATEETFLERLLRIVEQFRRFAMDKTASCAESRLDIEVAGSILGNALWQGNGHREIT